MQPRRVRWGRIALWSVVFIVVVIAAVLGGYYLWFSHLMSGANKRVDAGISQALKTPPTTSISGTVPASPGAMDVLILGSDKRPDVPGGRSDTIMLVHVDPARDFVSMLSLPRDWRVNIPGHGFDKLNEAYSLGGAALTIRTVKKVTGINITHYLQLDFTAFQELADSLGGVYIDVDRRYFNNDPTYEPINIQAGYQLLGGHDALEYVRYRHDLNTDFGRMLRQQRFLQALKEQMEAQGAGLLLKLPALAGDLFSNATTDLSADQILGLAYFGVKLGGGRIRQVRMTGGTPTINGVSYVVVSADEVQQAVSDYLNPPPAQAATTQAAPLTGTTGNPDLAAWRSLTASVPFAIEVPAYLPAGYAYFDQRPHAGQTYTINTGSGTKPAIRMIYKYNDRDQYLGISETTWLNAPIASPGIAVVQSGGITYTVVGTEDKVDHVWWKKDGVLYWVSNTLSYLLPQSEMLGVAESFQPLPAQ